ncbi:acetyl-CoA carboxylase biotin carboxyl carrier protein [Desulfuromonas acetoxidans]|uniref:Biotin carboxyl carrier protein of acetyl-CoA carboxylase n=1 Tax=Desulfuromonas acetoxidans (strain DSM 684 / 11070) TaxID=281689 RepID=Q1K2Y1_DESA6|nr:acetyl-CoA carboxylase biotin carboxyl carrier protein [Desulfuromonas acetoxidans]EAT16750.1 acetyl-CoA carboxylase, biotin carboxyl carrier protein [Desulfuromonas acetoxidans DSM 684]MBF0644790.1 acetyl-CoA carboxylase biotin carboxyl carrier protein [Desulfuromonas acetoxidans]NVD23692.1 acetyl-CoA carboxylase biotin carboxyl carrier protein [Desulfuromonas acetoxidans]NVE15923.1 acetyl-CoA carboxylase biotin carboxyl carrier protein [Desulfuromonas acetoxidans]
MDIKDIKSLIKVITDTDITEFEMENEEQRIVIKRGSEPEVVHVSAPAYAPAQPAAPVPAAAPAAAAAPADVAPAAVNDQYDTIPSPIVGTFYAAPSPDSDPYVKVGDVVEAGQTLCIVEAMKLMNEIEAEFKCKIIEISKANAQPVEFGDALFVVEKV